MECIANRNTAEALSIVNRFYSEGKDMGALLDEMACLARDFLVMKTAPKEGINMLSGVASDAEVKVLAERFSAGELVRMLNLLQATISGFSRSASRRMDAELCIINLCSPQLELDVDSLLSRLTRIEDQLKSGQIVCTAVQKHDETDDQAPLQAVPANAVENNAALEEEYKPIVLEDQAPVGFWADVASAVRQEAELRVPVLPEYRWLCLC